MGCIFVVDSPEVERLIKEVLTPLVKEKITVQIIESYYRVTIQVFKQGEKPWGGGIVHFSMSTLPGCCAYVVLHDVLVFKEYRGLGIAQALHPVKEFIADDGGFSFMMCTTRKDNPTQNHILEKTEWKKAHQGLNVRTKNDLIMWVKGIT